MSGRYTVDYRQEMRLLRTPSQRVIAVILTIVALALPFVLGLDWDPPLGFPWAAWRPAVNFALVAAIGAAAFNLLLGYTHQVSVAHAAFLMLGTVVGAGLGTLWHVNFLVVMVAATIAGALIGILVGLPALRFRGLYLLIATFGVHFFFLLGYRKFQTALFGFSPVTFADPQLPSWLHGLSFINPDENGVWAFDSDFRWYWILLPLTVLSVLFMSNVIRMREGRSFMAIKEHDISASLIGINVTRAKLKAFAVSSAFVSLSGALGAYYIGARDVDSFGFHVVLNYSIMIIVGGFSTFQGAIMGAFFFYLAPVLFDWIREDVPGIRDVEFLQNYANELNLAIFGDSHHHGAHHAPDRARGDLAIDQGVLVGMAVQPVTSTAASAPHTTDGSGLTVRGLEVVYKSSIVALSGVSVQVPTGGFVSVLGANGAGKTTLVRAITNLLVRARRSGAGGRDPLERRPAARRGREPGRARRCLPGAGGPQALPPADGRGQPAGRRGHAPGQRRHHRGRQAHVRAVPEPGQAPRGSRGLPVRR